MRGGRWSKLDIGGIIIRLILGASLGIPLIILGQSASVFLDQKELLELIHESLLKKELEKV